jgi:MYXO-CTERM domain-containing protein
MFEPSDSRLRIVLDMRDFGPNPGSVGRVAIASNEEDDAAGGLGGIATLWAEPQPTPLEEVSDPDQPRDPLGGIVEDPGPLVTLPLVEPQATPEPGTLALAAVGLGMIGWHCRRIVRRLEFRA